MLKTRNFLALAGFLSLGLFAQAERWVCCIGIPDGTLGSTACLNFKTKAECASECSSMCTRVAETNTKDVWD